MKRKNTTRNALFTSIISLLLCVSMLVGTTFAWFTDEVQSGRNVIAAGNLDVELYNVREEKNVDGDDVLFDDVKPNLWEPGALAYENLQVKNVGSLALKYDLELSVLDETVVNGYKLSDVIMVGLVENGVKGTTRDAVIEEVTSWTKLSEFSLNMNGVKLNAGEDSLVYGIVLYWQPNSNEIDNRYNMNNENQGKTLQLDIGVNLYATQVEEESDSFGIDYDAGAYIEDSAALEDALTQNKETIIVNLTSDVTWDLAAWDNNPMGGELTKTIAINGNGHTITFNKTNSDWTNVVTGDAVLIIENATITDSGYDATSGTWNGHDITFKDAVKLNNVTLLNAIALMDDATLTDVTLTDDSTSDAYGIWIRPNGQTVTIDGLQMDMTTSDGNDRGIKIDNEYSEDSDKGVTLNVKNASFKTEKKAAILVKSTGDVKIDLENVDISGVAADPFNEVWIDEENAAYAGKTSVTGGTKVVEGSEDVPSIKTVTNDAELATALADSSVDVIYLESGTYGVIDVAGVNRTLTLQAANGATVKLAGVDGQSNATTTNITIKGVTIDNSLQTEGWYTGTSPNMKVCVGVWGGNYTFEDCVFYVTGESKAETGVMSWWTINHGVMNFTNCTFNGGNSSARAMQIYGDYDLNVTGCTFNTAKDYSIKYVGEENCVATFKNNNVTATTNFVQTGSATYAGKNYKLVFEGNTLASGINHVYVDNDENQTIIIDGETYVAPTAWTALDTVSGDVTRENMVAEDYVEIAHNSGNLTLKNVTFKNGLTIFTTNTANNGTVTLEDCTIYLSNGTPANSSYNMCKADYGVYLDLANGSTMKVKFVNCTFTKSTDHTYTGNQGYNIYITGDTSAESISFEGCTFEGSAKHGIGCSAAKAPYYALKVTGCNFKDWNNNSGEKNNGAAIRGNLPSADFNANITISGNTFGDSNNSTQTTVAIDSWTGTWN